MKAPSYKDFPLNKPFCDGTGVSDFYVVFTNDGQMDIAVYNESKNLWYSLTDPTGFNNVKWYTDFDIPSKFEYSAELSELWNGEGEYM